MDKETQAVSKGLLGPGLFFGAIIFIGLLGFFGPNGGFAGNIDKSYFYSVDSYISESYKEAYIIFEDPSPKNQDVWVDPDKVEVKIDSSLFGTAISATPKLSERFMGESRVFYKARSAIVWVQDTEEKAIWKAFIRRVRILKEEMTNDGDTPRKVLP